MTNVNLPDKTGFNALRLFCCVVIVVGHCLDLSGLSSIYYFANFLDMHSCVCVFFILSGFFVTRSYMQRREKGDGALSFYARRAKRILPSYYAVILLCAVGFFFLSECAVREYLFSGQFWKYLFWNALFLNFVCVSPIPKIDGGGQMYSVPVNGALWTIKIEVSFYLVLPLVVHVVEKIKSKKGKNIFFAFCYAASILWNIFFELLGRSRNSSLISDMAHQFPGFVSYFVSGMLCIYNWKFLQRNLNRMIVPALCIFFLHYFTHTEILMPLALTICVIWFGITLGRLSFIGEKVDFSYGIYLTHFPIVQFCVALGYFVRLPIFAICMVLGASFAMAYLMNFVMSWMELKSNAVKMTVKGESK